MKGGLIPASFRYSVAAEEAMRERENMGGILGTVGCAAAHFKAQTRTDRRDLLIRISPHVKMLNSI